MNPFRQMLRWFQRKNATAAELLPSYRIGRPIDKDWDSDRAIKEGYRASEWVYACISRRAAAVASIPWYAERIQSDGEWARIPYAQSPLEQLLEHPNAYMSRQSVMERLTQHQDTDGNGLLTIIAPNRDAPLSPANPPLELWPIQTRPLRPIPTRMEFIRAYEYQDGDVLRELDATKVLHFMYGDPLNPYWGMPPLRAISRAVNTQVEAIRWNASSLSNRAMPELAFHTDQPLNQQEWEDARNEVALNYAGPDNARLPIVTGGGMQATVVNWKPIEMDFIASLAYYREAICAAYGVPLPMVQVMADATLANLDTSRQQFWEDTVIPLLDNFAAGFNRVLAPAFGKPGELRVCYDLSGVRVLREDFGAKVTQLKDMVMSGVPLNAALKRLEMDIEDVEGGDDGFIPATMVPLKDAASIANEPKVTAQPRLAA